MSSQKASVCTCVLVRITQPTAQQAHFVNVVVAVVVAHLVCVLWSFHVVHMVGLPRFDCIHAAATALTYVLDINVNAICIGPWEVHKTFKSSVYTFAKRILRETTIQSRTVITLTNY